MKLANGFLRGVVSTFFFLICTVHAGDGHATGNGGDAIVCRGSRGQIISAELLDLYEGASPALHRLHITKSNNESVTTQMMRVTEKIRAINQEYAAIFEREYTAILQNKRLMPAGARLENIGDAFNPVTPRDCPSQQLANYTDMFGLLIDSTIFRFFGSTDEAALYTHEAIYKIERERLGATDSVHTRVVVAYLFSDSPLSNAILLDGKTLGRAPSEPDPLFSPGQFNVRNADAIFETLPAPTYAQLQGLWVQVGRAGTPLNLQGTYDESGLRASDDSNRISAQVFLEREVFGPALRPLGVDIRDNRAISAHPRPSTDTSWYGCRMYSSDKMLCRIERMDPHSGRPLESVAWAGYKKR